MKFVVGGYYEAFAYFTKFVIIWFLVPLST